MMDAILGRCWDHLDKKEQAYVCMYNVCVCHEYNLCSYTFLV